MVFCTDTKRVTFFFPFGFNIISPLVSIAGVVIVLIPILAIAIYIIVLILIISVIFHNIDFILDLGYHPPHHRIF
jgi:hypothetical protein